MNDHLDFNHQLINIFKYFKEEVDLRIFGNLIYYTNILIKVELIAESVEKQVSNCYFAENLMTLLQKGQCAIFIRRKWEKVGKKASNNCNLLMKTPKNAIKVGNHYL